MTFAEPSLDVAESSPNSTELLPTPAEACPTFIEPSPDLHKCFTELPRNLHKVLPNFGKALIAHCQHLAHRWTFAEHSPKLANEGRGGGIEHVSISLVL